MAERITVNAWQSPDVTISIALWAEPDADYGWEFARRAGEELQRKLGALPRRPLDAERFVTLKGLAV